MKRITYLLLIFLISVSFSCSNDDDDNGEVDNLENYTIEYIFEGSYSATGYLTFSSFSGNNLVEEANYDNFPEDEFTQTDEVFVESANVITGQIKINDSNMSFRGNATINIINSNDEVVANIEGEYLNTDTPQVTSYIDLSYNTETGQINIDGEY